MEGAAMIERIKIYIYACWVIALLKGEIEKEKGKKVCVCVGRQRFLRE